jgi:hypothetical protein
MGLAKVNISEEISASIIRMEKSANAVHSCLIFSMLNMEATLPPKHRF